MKRDALSLRKQSVSFLIVSYHKLRGNFPTASGKLFLHQGQRLCICTNKEIRSLLLVDWRDNDCTTHDRKKINVTGVTDYSFFRNIVPLRSAVDTTRTINAAADSGIMCCRVSCARIIKDSLKIYNFQF